MTQPKDNTDRLDEILSRKPLDDLTDVQFIKLRQALLQWVSDEVVGKDVNWTREQCMKFSTNPLDSFAHLFAVNTTKSKQRAILKQHGFKGGV